MPLVHQKSHGAGVAMIASMEYLKISFENSGLKVYISTHKQKAVERM